MVWEVIAAAAFGGFAGAGVQALVSRQNVEKQISAQDNRRVGEIYLEKKVDALTDFQAELNEFFEELNVLQGRAYGDDLTQEEYEQEVQERYNEYNRMVVRVGSFLTEDQHETVNETLPVFEEACEHIRHTKDMDMVLIQADYADQWNGDELAEHTNEAMEVVRQEIRDGVQRLESD